MNTAVRTDSYIQEVCVTKDEITVYLADGRVVSVPLAWSWRLSEATPAQRANFRLIGTGQGIHWPEIDEDVSIEGMLHGEPARRPKSGHVAIKVFRERGQVSPNKSLNTDAQKARAG
jgi:hypothetical protein